MTPLLNSSSKTKKVQLFTLLFSFFIIYCVYSLSMHTPAPSRRIQEMIDTATTLPSCTTDVLRNVDPNHTNAHLRFWQHLPDQTVKTYQKRWKKFISTVKETKAPVWENERGIVLVAGNKDTFQRTMTTIKLLRDYGTQLDIEVWHLSDEQPSDTIKSELNQLNAKARDLSDPELVRPIQTRRDADKQ